MDDVMLEQRLENLDRRLARVEQFLPTLATKDDLKTLATKEELTTLATKAELQETVGLLATKKQIRELRRHMDVLHESQRGDIQLLAEHLTVVMSKLTER